MSDDMRAIVEAINDLTRVTIALSGEFKAQAEIVRRLDGLSIPPSRIGAILAIPTKDVSSILAKARKKAGGDKEEKNG